MNKNVCFDLIVVGAGGTGGYFIKEVARYLCDNKYSSIISSMSIIDGDVVEEKNIKRQAFQKDDIGAPKASVLSESLNYVFEEKWRAYCKYIYSLKDLEDILADAKDSSFYSVHIPVIIGAVDNHGARIILEEFFNKNENVIYYDSANEFSDGEVVFSYKLDGKIVSPLRSYFFPEILKGDVRNRDEISCTELNEVSPQHISTNMKAGNILLSEFVYMLEAVYEQREISSSITKGYVMFDTKGHYEEVVLYNQQMREAVA